MSSPLYYFYYIDLFFFNVLVSVTIIKLIRNPSVITHYCHIVTFQVFVKVRKQGLFCSVVHVLFVLNTRIHFCFFFLYLCNVSSAAVSQKWCHLNFAVSFSFHTDLETERRTNKTEDESCIKNLFHIVMSVQKIAQHCTHSVQQKAIRLSQGTVLLF